MRDLFITCPHGFEPILEKELKSLGVRKVFPRFSGVLVPKTMEHVFIGNYLSRVATRVLWPLASFPCRGKEDLYNEAKKVRWSDILNCKKTFALDANVQHPTLKNSLFASLVVKDAICDYFREKEGERPSVSKQFPDVQLNLFIQKGEATLYLDTSGAPLHKRGWREENTEATLHESLAAALLLFLNYDPEKHILCDPFCGSGTFLVEAALLATHTPPGFFRKKWGFFHLPSFEQKSFLSWKKEQDAKRIPLPKNRIFGSDKSREASETARKHLQKAGFSGKVEVDFQDVGSYTPPCQPNFILTNPPYGKRLDTSVELFCDLRAFLDKKAFFHCPSHILFPGEESAQELLQPSGMLWQEKLAFRNGGLPVKLLALRSS